MISALIGMSSAGRRRRPVLNAAHIKDVIDQTQQMVRTAADFFTV